MPPLTDNQKLLAEQHSWMPGSFARTRQRSFHRLNIEDIESLCNEVLIKAVRAWPGKGEFSQYAYMCFWRWCRLENNRVDTLEPLYFGGRNGGKVKATGHKRTKNNADPVARQPDLDARMDYDTLTESLDATSRDLIDLRYRQQLSNRAIGAKYGLTHQAIHKRFNKLLLTLASKVV